MNDAKKQTEEEIRSSEKLLDDFLDAGDDMRSGEAGVHPARQVNDFLKTPRYLFSVPEKEKLKRRVQYSVIRFAAKRRILKWTSVAAIFMVGVFGSYGLYIRFHESDLVNFAKNMVDIQPNEETRLFLQDGKEVLIEKQESTIEYGKSGKDILISAEEKVVQALDTKEPVYNTVVVPYGKRTQITLSEGTQVWLNSGSKLIYPAVFASKKREVYIDGEAIFDVTHLEGTPFFVNSHGFSIKVTGTVFNVSSYSDDIESSTVLESGRIELHSNDKSLLGHDKVDVLPGEIVVFNPDENMFSKSTVKPQDYLSWRNGYFVFKNERLNNILKKIGRYYNVDIQVVNEALSAETFTGSLDLRTSPDEVLKIIGNTIRFDYDNKGNKFLIY